MLRVAATSPRAIMKGTGQHSRSILAGGASATEAPSPVLSQNFKWMPIRRSFSSRSDPANYQCVHVFVSVKPGTENDFLAASLANARASSQEPGIARFDIIRQEDDPTKFVLVEVYKNADAPAAHKGTNHYLAWRKTVEHMMAKPRKAIKYHNLFPTTAGGWDYGDGVSSE